MEVEDSSTAAETGSLEVRERGVDVIDFETDVIEPYLAEVSDVRVGHRLRMEQLQQLDLGPRTDIFGH